ncbi:MAG: hypothetical protein IJ008_03580 [Clostridia bacterium]|nr:hypothetical protein [Clostridia bacterium]
MEELDNLTENTDSMLKLRLKGKLINDISSVFSEIAQNKGVYAECGRFGRRFKNKAVKSIYTDFCKGLKSLDKKIPVFIEIPKLQEYSNGTYEEVHSNKKERTLVSSPIQKEVEGKIEEVKYLVQ